MNPKTPSFWQKLFGFLFFLLCVSCQRSFDRHQLLQNLVEQGVMPAHQTFLQHAQTLEIAVHAFQIDPNLQTLEAVQKEWQTTALSWEACELYSFEFAMILHNQIGKWPTNPRFIEGFVASEGQEINANFVETVGSTSKGLPAMEYLLFAPKQSPDVILQQFTTDVSANQRMAYLVALSENLHQKAKQLLALWSADGSNQAAAFIQADFDGGELNGSISMLTNEMVALLENLIQNKVGRPLGEKSGGKPQPELVEAPYSGDSLPFILANLQAFELAFNGGEGLGLDDYLDFLPASAQADQPLAEKINQQLEQTMAAFSAISLPLEQTVLAQPEQLAAANSELRALLVLVKVDMANQLGVTITFNDSDGD